MKEYYQNLVEKCKKEIILPELAEEFEEYISQKYNDDLKAFTRLYTEEEAKRKASSNVENLIHTMSSVVSREREGLNQDRNAMFLEDKIKQYFDRDSEVMIPLIQFTLEGADIARNYYKRIDRMKGTHIAEQSEIEIVRLVRNRTKKVADIKGKKKTNDTTIEDLMKRCKNEIIIPELFDNFKDYIKETYESLVEYNKFDKNENEAKQASKETIEEVMNTMLNTISRKRAGKSRNAVANYLYEDIEKHMWVNSYGGFRNEYEAIYPLLYYTEDGPEILKDYYRLLEQKGQCKSAEKMSESIDDIVKKRSEKIANMGGKKNRTENPHSTSGKNTSSGTTPNGTGDGMDIEF